MRVWKIITDLTEEENNRLDKVFSKEDGQIMRDLFTDEKIFAWDEVINNVMYPYAICTDEVMELVSDIAHKYNIKFGPIDITDEFLMGVYEIPDEDFIRYREENMTEDLVYEKLKRFGACSLTDFDKGVLANC